MDSLHEHESEIEGSCDLLPPDHLSTAGAPKTHPRFNVDKYQRKDTKKGKENKSKAESTHKAKINIRSETDSE